MSTDESLDVARQQEKVRSIPSDADDWGRLFVKQMRLEFAERAAQIPGHATESDFRRVMMAAILATFGDAGASAAELVQLVQANTGPQLLSDRKAEWTSEDNARRMVLIDKWLQRTITQPETMELERLTAWMRLYCDREAVLPLEGARRLHGQLLGGAPWSA